MSFQTDSYRARNYWARADAYKLRVKPNGPGTEKVADFMKKDANPEAQPPIDDLQ